MIAVISCALALGFARLQESANDTPERLVPSLRGLAGNRWALVILAFTVTEGVLLIGVYNYLAVALQTTGASVLAAGAATAMFGAAVVIVSQLMKLILDRWATWVLMLLAGISIVSAYTAVAVQISIGHRVDRRDPARGGLGVRARDHADLDDRRGGSGTAAPSGCPCSRSALFVGASAGAAAGNIAAGTGHFGALFAISAVVSVAYAAASTVARARYVERE